MLGKAMCRIGLHKWQWEYGNSTSCEQIGHCKRCKTENKKRRTRHQFGEWVYERDKSCRLIKICTRCSTKETGKIQHQWGEWQKLSDRCIEKQTCQRCNETSERDISHDWGDWRYEQPKHCQKVRSCRHCGKKEIGDIAHQWGDWTYKAPDTCWQERKCERCDNTEEEIAEHNWGAWQYESPTSCDLIRFCTRCQIQETGGISHKWGKWIPESSGACRQIRRCQRCNEEDELEKWEHRWGDWQYADVDACHQVGICLQCGERHPEGKFVHKWKDWQYENEKSCEIIRECNRCNIEVEDTIHEWNKWKEIHPFDEYPSEIVRKRTCRRCRVWDFDRHTLLRRGTIKKVNELDVYGHYVELGIELDSGRTASCKVELNGGMFSQEFSIEEKFAELLGAEFDFVDYWKEYCAGRIVRRICMQEALERKIRNMRVKVDFEYPKSDSGELIEFI